MKPLTTTQHRALVAHLEQAPSDYWNAMLELIARTGARVSEALMVTRPDFDVKRKEVRIQGVKGSRGRVVPLPEPAMLRIMEGISRPPDTAQVSQVRRLQRHWECLRFHLFGCDAQGVTLHGLRATVALAAYAAGGKDIMVPKELLGHVSVASTGRYLEGSRIRGLRDKLLRHLRGGPPRTSRVPDTA